MKYILLCCGMGMSSGFLAVNLRKAAKKKMINYKIEACSSSEVTNYIPWIDILLVTPPFSNRINEFKEYAKNYNVDVKLIPDKIYSELNGEKLLKFIQ